MKKGNMIAKLFTAFFIFVVLQATPTAEGAQRLSIASAGAGGTWYWVGAAMAQVINTQLSGVEAVNEQTSGASENIKLVDAGKVDIGMSTTDMIVFAYEGNQSLGFRKKYTNLRAIMSGHESLNVYVSLEKRGIRTLKDLKGSSARLSTGPAGTGAEPHVRAVLKAHGLDLEKDIKIIYLSFSEQIEALKDGILDVGRIGGGIPTASIVDISRTHDVRLVSVDRTIVEKQNAENPYWGLVKIPAGTYRGQKEDYWAPSEGSMAFVRQDMAEELVYRIIKTLMENVDNMAKIHPSAADWNLQNSQKMITIPFHPGAIKYYKERGVWKGK